MELTLREVLTTVGQVIYLYCEALWRWIIPPKRMDVRGQRVLVTGGGHGIGREIAVEFGRLGAEVILWDINKNGLDRSAQILESFGTKVYTYRCDVSNADDIRRTAQKVQKEVGDVDILVNNAGILNGGPLLEMTEADIRKTFEVNTLAQFWTIRQFLPGMITRKHGLILNIASASSRNGTAYLTDYSASKAAVLVMSEALSEELMLLGHTGVHVTAVCPAFVNTGLCKSPKDRINRLLSAKETALAAIDGLLRGEMVVYVPKSLFLGIKVSELLPQGANSKIKASLNFGIDPQYRDQIIVDNNITSNGDVGLKIAGHLNITELQDTSIPALDQRRI